MTDHDHPRCAPSKTQAAPGSRDEPPHPGDPARRTVWASIGLGVLASACCWIPLALAGAGVATGTLGARIAWIRPWALGALLLLLLGVLGWWARKRFARVEAGDCCAAVPRFPTLAVTILMGSFVAAWAAPRLLHEGKVPVPVGAAPTGGIFLVLATPQFDCAPCAGDLPRTLAATPGVASVQMDFNQRETRVVFRPGAAVDATLTAWKKNLGFKGKELQRKRL